MKSYIPSRGLQVCPYRRASILILLLGLWVFVGLHVLPSHAAPAAQRSTPTQPVPDTPAPTATPEPPPTETPSTPPATAPTETLHPTQSPDTGSSPDSDGNDDDEPYCLSRVEGFVLTSEGAAVPNQTVQLTDGGWSLEGVTDSNGFFYFDGLCAGDLTVNAIVNGEVAARAPASVSSDAGVVVQVSLQIGASRQAQPTVPTSTRPPGTATATASPIPPTPTRPKGVAVERLPQTGLSKIPLLGAAGAFALLMLLVGIARRRLFRS